MGTSRLVTVDSRRPANHGRSPQGHCARYSSGLHAARRSIREAATPALPRRTASRLDRTFFRPVHLNGFSSAIVRPNFEEVSAPGRRRSGEFSWRLTCSNNSTVTDCWNWRREARNTSPKRKRGLIVQDVESALDLPSRTLARASGLYSALPGPSIEVGRPNPVTPVLPEDIRDSRGIPRPIRIRVGSSAFRGEAFPTGGRRR